MQFEKFSQAAFIWISVETTDGLGVGKNCINGCYQSPMLYKSREYFQRFGKGFLCAARV